MKAMLIVLVIAGVGFLVIRSVITFKPEAQCEEAMDAIATGMNWSDVVDIMAPKEYRAFSAETRTIGGEEIQIVTKAALNKFNPETFGDRVKKGTLPHGFMFEYVCTSESAFSVRFNGEGFVEKVRREKTRKQILLQQED